MNNIFDIMQYFCYKGVPLKYQYYAIMNMYYVQKKAS